MGTILAAVLLLLPQEPASPQALASGLVLAAEGVPLEQAFQLGDGGVLGLDAGLAGLPGDRGTCTTPGGVLVECRSEGVKLTFPSKRELLCAPDGFLHLRDGGAVGPVAGGVELRLLDGSCVRIELGSSRRFPMIQVEVVTSYGAGVRLWRRGQTVREPARGSWNGERMFCLGDGGAIYRAVALGPLVLLQRALAPRGDPRPAARLCLQTGPMLDSLKELVGTRAAAVDPQDIAEARFVIENGERILLAKGPPPPRISTDPLQFMLAAGYDLRLSTDESGVRLQLARHEEPAFVEWKLGYISTVQCAEAGLHLSSHRVPVDATMPELRPRLERHEIGVAFAVVAALRAGAR